ncbi:thioredoxin domain-containing protein 11-like [Pecten maximus]|uniref:thioredoxin domain-containing protein 11-like n=1 Tax=Pecten maximus TaxID=6579 RepID=UPI001458DCEB|nr:thioredoxin domain-containing protein 11-like [Pecten maximus]
MANTTSDRQRKGLLHRTHGVYKTMAKHRNMSVTVIGVTLFLLINFSSSFKGKQMVIPPKPPERFFPVGSAVLDFPYGNINPVTNLLNKEEIMFVMYYAPWCSKSRQVRDEFAKAAKYFQNRVRFVAINCWWPDGECRSSYKLISYPELFIYHTNLDGFKFTGIPTADYMIKFTEDILYPLKILHTREQIKEFNSRYDNVMIGFFDFHASPQPPGYRQFYLTAMRLLEKDFNQPVRTAIVTQPSLASLLGLHTTKSLILHRLTNTSLLYPQSNNFTYEYITHWIGLYKQQPVVQWLSPPGHKTQHLSSAINMGPAMLVFTPVNQLHTDRYYYNMVREIALHYLNCNNSFFIRDAVELSIRRRVESLEGHLQQTDQCLHKQVYKNTLYMPPTNDKNCCISLVTSHDKEYSQDDSWTVCEYCKHVKATPYLEERSHLCMLDTPTSLSAGAMFSGLANSLPQCLNTVQDYNTNEYRTLCCKECSYNVLSNDKCSSRKTTDPFITKSNQIFQNRKCKKLKLQEEQNLTSPFDFVKDFSRFDVEKVNGLYCRSNRTLNLHVIDLKHHSVFLERLVPGYQIDVNTPAVVIVDKKNEAQFVLEETFNKKNLDFNQPVRTAIVTQPSLASLLGLHTTKSLILHRLTNTSLLYPQSNNFTYEYITHWIGLYKQQTVVQWLSPPGHKTQHLSSAINMGPAMLVFTPVNQLHTDRYYYNMVREIALHYLNCNNSFFIRDAVELSIRRRVESLEGHLQQTDQCLHKQVYKNTLYMPPTNDKNCCISLVTSHDKEYSQADSWTVCEYCKHVKATPFLEERSHLCMLDTPTSLSAGAMFSGLANSLPQCLNTVQDYNTNEYRTLCCKECSYNVLSNDKCSSRKTTDPFITKSNQIFQNRKCKKLKLQEEQNLTSPFDFVKDFSRFDVEKVNGLYCRSNRTLNLHVIDLKHHSVFLERLVPGYQIDVNTPAVVIVDKKNEAQFVLEETFNKKNLAQFMMNYTSSDLERHLRSGTIHSTCYGEHVGVCIKDATSQTFQDIALQQDKDVLVLLYAPWCGFCAGFAHLYLNLAKYFKTAQNLIFARINADTNDLPWEYTVNSYPTLLFFPAHRKSESVVFPASIPKTLPNLIKFVLHHSTHDLRLDTAVDICSNSCMNHNRVVVAATIETFRLQSHQYTRRLRRLMSHLASLNNAPSLKHHPDTMSEYSSSTDKDLPDDDLVLHRRRKLHSSIAYVQKQIRKTEKRVKDATHLHKYLLNHKNFVSGKEQLFKYFTSQILDKKSKVKS